MDYIQEILQITIDTINNVLDQTPRHLSDSVDKIVNRSGLQIGIVDKLEIKYSWSDQPERTKLTISTSNLDSEIDINYPFKEFTEDFVHKELLVALKESLNAYFEKFKNDSLLDVCISVTMNIQVQGKEQQILSVLNYVEEHKKRVLLEKINTYLEKKVYEGKYPNKELDIMFLSRHLLTPHLFDIIKIKNQIEIFERIIELNRKSSNFKIHIHNITFQLQKWAENVFLPEYFNTYFDTPDDFFFRTLKIGAIKDDFDPNKVDESGIDLLLYTSILILKYEPNYMHSIAQDYINYITQLGSDKGTNILKNGTGQFSKEEILYQDECVKCEANDVSTVFTITIKQESSESYAKAIDFMLNLLNKGFSGSYQIKLKSKTKNFLPIKKIGKTSTHCFFANALKYPILYPNLEKYVQSVTKSFEWYKDAENEFCAIPGTYALFGLCLQSSQYFPLAQYYIHQVDYEHQSIQTYFVDAFVEKYGITTEILPLLIEWILICDDYKLPKKFASCLLVEGLKEVFNTIIAQKTPYQQETILHSFHMGKRKR